MDRDRGFRLFAGVVLPAFDVTLVVPADPVEPKHCLSSFGVHFERYDGRFRLFRLASLAKARNLRELHWSSHDSEKSGCP